MRVSLHPTCSESMSVLVETSVSVYMNRVKSVSLHYVFHTSLWDRRECCSVVKFLHVNTFGG